MITILSRTFNMSIRLGDYARTRCVITCSVRFSISFQFRRWTKSLQFFTVRPVNKPIVQLIVFLIDHGSNEISSQNHRRVRCSGCMYAMRTYSYTLSLGDNVHVSNRDNYDDVFSKCLPEATM